MTGTVVLYINNLQYVDVSSATVKERLVQRLMVIEVDEGRKLLESHVAVAVGVHFLHQQPQVFVIHLNIAKIQNRSLLLKRNND